MPPTRGASGIRKSAARWRIRSQCSAALVSISPVAMGVSNCGRQRGVAFVVVGVQRLLDPDQVEVLERRGTCAARSGGPTAGWRRPSAARRRPGACAPPRTRRMSSARSGWPTLSLMPPMPRSTRGRGVDQQLLQRRVQEAARGVVAGHRVAVRAQQLGQRQAGAPRLQVVQRHVEGADGLRRQAAAAHRGAGPAQLVPQPGDVARVFADQRRRDLLAHAQTGPARRRAWCS